MQLIELFRPEDLLDILIVGAVLWAGLAWVRQSPARLALPGVAGLVLLYVAARRLGLELTAALLQGVSAVLVVVFVVVFRNELRRLYDQLSVWGLRRRPAAPAETSVDTIVRAVVRLAADRTGALLVFPGREPLERHLEGGIALDAVVSEPLLMSLFDASSPGHDGAVLVAGNRIARFAVHLPLSANRVQLGQLGTRHAAALGLAERTDALCVVVSEERGTVSVARNGGLRKLSDPSRVVDELLAFGEAIAPTEPARPPWRALHDRWREGAVSFALTVALWALLVPGANVVEDRREVKVFVDNMPQGWVLEAVDPPAVEVVVRGRRRDLVLANAGDLEARLDGFLVQLGRRTFEIPEHRIERPARVEILKVEPAKVRLRVRREEPEPSEKEADDAS